MKYQATRAYIRRSWQRAVKDKNVDEGFPLPYDYVPPCIDGGLTNLYYWDTYFTNIGLYLDGLDRYAFNNVENLKFCLRKFGCVPNMCRANGAEYCSQPPLLFLMIEDYYARTGNIEFLKDGYEALKTEYAFWMTRRIAENGLNRYGCNADYSKKNNADYYARRFKIDMSDWTEARKVEFCLNCMAEGESGEDHTPRFAGRAKYVNPLDLNCYLYAFEKTMARFSGLLGAGEEKTWIRRAEDRSSILRKYCYDEETGAYFDYDYERETRTGIYCVACYLPYVFGITKDANALEKINARLIYPCGVVSCQKMDGVKGIYQWGYPNAWAPHQYWAYLANERAGKEALAKEIAQKFLDNVADEFSRSGRVLEKYDALQGGGATVQDYGLIEMLGWTAGVYNYFYDKRYKEA